MKGEIKMENSRKLQITEESLTETKENLSGSITHLNFLRIAEENKNLVSKEELKQLEEALELIKEIRTRVYDKSIGFEY